MTAAPGAWKGLDTKKKPVYIGYDRAERMIASLLDRAAAWRPDGVVGIARGGIVPASMAAGILALPLSFLTHDKSTGAMSWLGPPCPGRRVLLVDDCCSSGETLRRARDATIAEGRDCLTLTIVHDPDVARYVPDLSHPMRDLFRLPWERGEATPTGRAAKAAGGSLDLSAEAPFHGIALTGGVVAAMASETGREAGPGTLYPSERAVLFAEACPESARAAIQARLADTPYRHLPLTWDRDGASPAERKIAAAIEWGCTHFVDSNPDHAIRIAAEAPHLIVIWRPDPDGRGWVVGAATNL